MSNTKIYWLHTLSPTHVGTGRGIGYIDLPIQREKVTNWPVIPGSALKGVWAAAFDATKDNRKDDPELGIAFGRAANNGSNSGALMPTDARLVCLPVRSFQGTFAWCTSPLALHMLHRDLTLAGMAQLPPVPPPLTEQVIHRTANTVLEDEGRIFLEDLDFDGNDCPTASAWADQLASWIFPGDEQSSWRKRFIERFAVVPDTVFDFLTETGTEVTARVKIDDDSKTVANGQLWNEESLPAETVLFGFVACDRIYSGKSSQVTSSDLLSRFATEALTLQIGGKATIGRGRVRCTFTSVGE